MRQDPPFDMAYVTATHILEMLPPTTKVLNNPAEVRNAPKIAGHAVCRPDAGYSDFSIEKIRSFRGQYKDIIVNRFW